METLVTQALGLTAPWSVASVVFSPADGAINFRVVCDAKRLPCPRCGAADQPIHDRKERTWRHLDFFQYKTFIHADLPRVALYAVRQDTPGVRAVSLTSPFAVAFCWR